MMYIYFCSVHGYDMKSSTFYDDDDVIYRHQQGDYQGIMQASLTLSNG